MTKNAEPLTRKMEISNDSVRSAYLYYVQAMMGAIQEGIMDKECGWFALQLLAEAFQAVSGDVKS